MEIYVAVAMFRRRISGWWFALLAELAPTAFLVLKLERSPDSAWTRLAIQLAYLMFLLWLRRYFPRKGSVGNGSASRALDVTSPGH